MYMRPALNLITVRSPNENCLRLVMEDICRNCDVVVSMGDTQEMGRSGREITVVNLDASGILNRNGIAVGIGNLEVSQDHAAALVQLERYRRVL
mgnify:CR=1 FL=1